jgi:YspA, cpYpsA-related SLOG family
MATDRDGTDFEPLHASSSTDHVLTELQLYGYRPFQDDPDPRPLPEANAIGAAVADIFDALVTTLPETRLEPDLESLLWSTVNLFHRAADRVQRDLDDNEDAQKRSQKEQDSSEIRSVELERLVAEGITLIERRNSMELFRDLAADQFERHTGSAWRPRSGSMVNHRTLTAAMIDSCDFLAAKRRAETEVLLPAGAKIAFTGGLEFNGHAAIWDTLDKVRTKHPDMVLLHGGSPKGAERIAACWADNRRVTQVVFKPDWNRHARAAPFKRNDRILDVLPIGVIVFPGSGVSANLADKAKKLGIPVWKYGGA